MRAPATRGLQSQAALVSAQRIESCEQSPSSGRRALHGACFWGLKNKHFWLRGCGLSLYICSTQISVISSNGFRLADLSPLESWLHQKLALEA